MSNLKGPWGGGGEKKLNCGGCGKPLVGGHIRENQGGEELH